MTTTNPHVATVDAALRALAAGESMPRFGSAESARLLAALGAVSANPTDLQRVGLAALEVLVQASRADAIADRAVRVAASRTDL